MSVEGSHFYWKTWKNIVHLEKSWNFAKNNKNHGNILEFCQSGNVGTLGYCGNDIFLIGWNFYVNIDPKVIGGHIKNIRKYLRIYTWNFLEKSWKYHEILLVQKCGNPAVIFTARIWRMGNRVASLPPKQDGGYCRPTPTRERASDFLVIGDLFFMRKIQNSTQNLYSIAILPIIVLQLSKTEVLLQFYHQRIYHTIDWLFKAIWMTVFVIQKFIMWAKLHNCYDRMRNGNNFTLFCLSVQATTFEPLKLGTSISINRWPYLSQFWISRPLDQGQMSNIT